MVQLRSCYFCGAVGDSLREYEVVPERLDPSGDGRSAVLCSDCHEKLRRVVEPLAGAADPESGEGSVDPAPASHQEVTFESATDDGDSAGPPDGPTGTAADDATTEEDGAAAAGSATDDKGSPSGGEGTREADDDDDVPAEYYKVLRLLQNREFPMDRADLTGLVTGAYDVSEPQCERIIETAIDRGVLVAEGSTLDLGRN
ncbi:hypothetical protein [Haloplanus pelagicus]|jgi:hypothetical protein|uniref:hypothetical protein n=1 Tax=Haloplanus pelagicus TaxID=2949995 RepID=UPI00203B90AC|nr:hypothetical protein [Haloplanus sp. HW8-1]